MDIINQVQIPEKSKDEIKNMLRLQCQKMGAEDKVEEVTNATHAFVDCAKGLVDVNQLKNEIEKAKPNGALDEVFKKYCAKTPELKTCIHTLLDGVSPCLDATARDQLTSAKNGSDQLIDFVCYKDGDRIALFISEHGPECFQDKANAIRECANTIKDSVKTVEDAKNMTLTLSGCIVTALEGCSTPTPSNMAESLFRYVRKGSPCSETP
ncbi:hypothetical protein OBRU01_01617, partial [Operophtera brumata]